MLSKLQITHTEIKTVLDLLYRQYGYDFSNYTKASLRRRLQKLMYDKKTVTDGSFNEFQLIFCRTALKCLMRELKYSGRNNYFMF